MLGIWSEEIDALYDYDSNSVVFKDDNPLKIKGRFEVHELCDLIHTEDSQVLAVYGQDFYKGRPALTVNSFGKGKAYYIAARTKEDFNDEFYGKLIDTLNIKRAINADLPYGVTAQMRTDGKNKFIFLLNFIESEKKIEINDLNCTDLLSGEKINNAITLSPYGIKILKC